MHARRAVPLWQRPGDLGFVCFFAASLFLAVMLDCIPALVPAGPITADVLDSLSWPPPVMRRAFMWWCEHADPLLRHNPLWYQCVCALSPLFYAPFYALAIYAFVYECDWIRPLSLMWSGSILVTMLPVWWEALVLPDLASPRPLSFMAAYGAFAAVPVLLAARVARLPFNKVRSPVQTIPLSIWARFDDLLFVFYFVFAAYVSLTLDVIPLSVSGDLRKDAIMSLTWPPSEHVRRMYHSWLHDVDHLGLRNPPWCVHHITAHRMA